MADNYTEFSERISDLSSDERRWVEALPTFEKIDAAELATALREYGIDAAAAQDIEMFPDFGSVIDQDGAWWISAPDGHGDLDHVAIAVQAFIRKFRPDFVFTLTWAATCSKPRIGEFGGGWLVVSKYEMQFGNTWGAAEECAEAMHTGSFKA